MFADEFWTKLESFGSISKDPKHLKDGGSCIRPWGLGKVQHSTVEVREHIS